MDRLLPWLRRSAWLYVVGALLAAALAWRLAPGGDPGGQPETPREAAVVEREAAPGALVHVAGAVRRPGVYRLRVGARVQAAVRAAGGPTKRAFVAGLNMAATVQDGQQVVVPLRPTEAAAGGAGAGGATGPISLSSATAEQLETIEGVGPAIAGRIIEWRRQRGGFAEVDQLLEIPGIGEGRLEALRPHVVP